MKTGHRSTATPLAWVMTALVLYASLYPFSGWHWPAGRSATALLALPWPPWLTPLDEAFNLAGYVPLGLLVFLAAVRSGLAASWALLLAVAAPSALSYGCEVAQHLLPGRHPSLKDWLMNTLGALAGALVGGLVHMLGWLQRWHRLRQRWFTRHSAGALALLALWPAALLFPAPLPWGLGQVGPLLTEVTIDVLQGVPWAEGWLQTLASPAEVHPLSHLMERTISALGLLAPVMLAYSVTRPGLQRLMLAALSMLVGVAAMVLSTMLNFGPSHAWAWLTSAATVGAAGAAVAALALMPLPQRLMQGLALVTLTLLVALVAQAPTDPYFAQSLQAWEQGRWVRFHGLAQWVGWLWPFAALGWLLARLTRPDPP